jgi:hypothetical protein
MAESLATMNPTGIFSESYNGDKVNKDSFANFMIRTFPRGAHPMLAMSQYWKPMPGGPVVRTEHGYHVKKFIFGHIKINAVGGYDNDDVTWTVDSTAGLIPGATFQVPATREIIRIVSVTSATVVVVARAFGRVAANVVADDAVLFCTGNAHTEASTRPVGRTTKSLYVPNYTSILRNAWGISGSAAASMTQVKGYNNLAETKEECVMFHALDWERIAIWSQPIAPATDAATGKRIHATQGLVDAIYQHAPSNIYTAASTTTYAQLEAMLEAALMMGTSLGASSERIILTDTTGYKVISNIGRIVTATIVQMDYGATGYGQRFNKVRTTLGDFTVVEDVVLNGNNQPTGMAIVMDPSIMAVGYLGGRDSIEESIEGIRDGKADGLDAQVGGLLTEMVIATHVPSNCVVINGLTAAA